MQHSINTNAINYSIIIPNKGNENLLDLCLKSIITATLKRIDTEIILVDNNSYPIKPKIDIHFPSINYIYCPTPNRSLARNLGADLAKGDFLIFLDSDCILDEENFDQLIKNIDKFNHYINCFQARINKVEYREDRIYHLDLSQKQSMLRNYIIQNNLVEFPKIDTALFAIRKNTFISNGKFSSAIERYEDRAFGYQLFLNNELIYFVQDSIVLKIKNPLSFIQQTSSELKEIKGQIFAENFHSCFSNFSMSQRFKFLKWYELIFYFFWFFRFKFLKSHKPICRKRHFEFLINSKKYYLNQEFYIIYLNRKNELSFFNISNNESISAQKEHTDALLQSSLNNLITSNKDFFKTLFYLNSREIIKRSPENPT